MEPRLRETIRYTIRRSSLGTVLVAATERGLCALLIGEDRAELESDLARRFSEYEIVRDDAALPSIAARAVRLVESDVADGDGELPLDLQGTRFQRNVWQLLRRIPPGCTTTYTDLARRLGSPRAVRAVASACAANPVAIIVPCHRVVRRDGGLAGYRWGIERKRILLEREREAGAAARG